MKIMLSDTAVGKNSDIGNYFKNARKFILENKDTITFNHDEQKALMRSKDRMLSTVMNQLYEQAIIEDKLGIFTLLILDKVKQVPSWFLISWLDFDTLELKKSDQQSYNILSSIPEYREKILMDITPYYSRDRNTIVDFTSMAGRVVRDMLCRSYYQFNKLWLSPTLIYLLTKMYTMVVSSKIGRMYSLSIQEQYVVATILGVFFVNRCADSGDTINPMMWKMDYLSKGADTKQIYQYITEKYSEITFDLQAVVNTIVELGPSRLSKFNLSTLFSMNSNLTSNQLISLIALEYPPYWCYLILSAISGDKSSIYHTLKNLNLKREADELQTEMVRTRSFVRNL